MPSYTVPFVAGDTPGRDHLPQGTSPIADRPSGDFATLYPVGFTLDEMMKLAWLVRKWEVNGTADWVLVETLTTSDSMSYSPAVQDVQPYGGYDGQEHYARHKIILVGEEELAPDERYLTMAYGPNANYIAMDRTGPHVGAYHWRLKANFQATSGTNADLRSPVGYFDAGSNLFYPLLVFNVAMDTSDNPSFPGHAMTSYRALISGVGSNGRGSVVGSCTILGKSFDLYSASALTGPGFTLSMSAAFTLTPIEYWPYKNSVGDPVYDSTTGDTLNDPFS